MDAESNSEDNTLEEVHNPQTPNTELDHPDAMLVAEATSDNQHAGDLETPNAEALVSQYGCIRRPNTQLDDYCWTKKSIDNKAIAGIP